MHSTLAWKKKNSILYHNISYIKLSIFDAYLWFWVTLIFLIFICSQEEFKACNKDLNKKIAWS